MKSYSLLSPAERQELYKELLTEYNEYKSKGLTLDLSRGKPNSEQLDKISGLMNDGLFFEYRSESGFDCRNYGILDGLPEMKRLFSDITGVKEDYITVGGNSSLQLMYDALARAMMFGFHDSERPWSQEKGLKWICVVPGYDRHFRITELFGFELLSVKMTEDGPDMDEVERLVKDPKVKGIWCVPKYSNPTGNTYSDETVRRLVSMQCAAPDFRIMWDNAYGIHSFGDDSDDLADIFEEARKYGTEDRVLYFFSTSKITYPGGGVSFIGLSENNKSFAAKYLGAQTIGYDKLNQLRHVKYLVNVENTYRHMLMLGGEIKKKFDIVFSSLKVLEGLGVASWTVPKGGYFISLDCLNGTAKRVYELMKDAGVTITPAGATYPYGVDPEDKNLRIAPTYPANAELRTATEILALAVRLAALEKLGV